MFLEKVSNSTIENNFAILHRNHSGKVLSDKIHVMGNNDHGFIFRLERFETVSNSETS